MKRILILPVAIAIIFTIGCGPAETWTMEGTVTNFEVSMGGFGRPSVGILYFEDGRIAYINPEEQDPSVVILNEPGTWHFERWKTLGTQVYKVNYDNLGTMQEKN